MRAWRRRSRRREAKPARMIKSSCSARSSALPAPMAESAEDVNTLKRRGRRRLVGAIALVLAAVIVLPMVFDSEPKVGAPPVSVRIPGEEEVGFTPKVTPKTPAPDAKTQIRAAEKDAEKTAEKAPERAPEKAAEKEPAKAPEPAPKI